ncbi:hypothetical protein JA33_257 [Dickeya phage vB_DsoM_JA33]|uniref:Uncharacterized protein n=3 Tax=Salmondvirus TaxID=2733130 RepID=A0A386K7K6_9CAUD|nr:hypothetical protein HOU08_gp257 [Dickeya phage vB_DsoM_JA29]YP_009813701.1 hypothetical protein HOU32_gp256 [Dickeya phage vB_DsoM_JA11]AXG66983.1 hypothetical protein JA29_257 [Dickeya phage vB_DsoM_JA29]AXG67631.1 hypothetical protein JA33_257 [Dickeya phage vB_DsoM_JA33]AYD80061.1 hypothetical protein JA11_256 [Dickeya phage vB_DsoM_JA11]
MNPLHASQTAFYVLGSITLLAHLFSLVYRYMKIVEMRQKRRAKIAKQKTPLDKLRSRLKQAKREAYYRPKKL